MKNELLALLALFLSKSLFGQDINLFFLSVDSSSVVDVQFDFASISRKTTIHQKIDFYLEKIVLRDTNSIFYFTGFDSYPQLQEARKNREKLYSKIDTAEINADLHFLDLNQDGKMDCVYDRLNLSYDFQRIEIFMDIESKSMKSLVLPGFIITRYSLDQQMKFETYAWACCDEPFSHYRQVEIDDDGHLSQKHYHIPRRLEQPACSLTKDTFSTSNNVDVYENTNKPNFIRYLGQDIKFSNPEELTVLAYKNEWALVIGQFEHKKLPNNDNRIIG